MAVTVTLDIDGTRDADNTRAVGEALAETLRVLNHHTRNAEALPHASDVYELLGALEATVSRMPQLYQQLEQRLAAMVNAGELADDLDRNPGDVVAGVIDALTRAASDADTMQAALANAHSAAATLHNTSAS